MSSKKFRKGARPFTPHRGGGGTEDEPVGDGTAGMELDADAPEETARDAAGADGVSERSDCDGADSGSPEGADAAASIADAVDSVTDALAFSSGEEIEEPPAIRFDEELATLRRERDAYLDMARRERADFDNYRKRIERDLAVMKRESLADFLKDFFRPLDDMDRVLIESEKTHSFEALVTGVRIMEENFWRALARAGVKKIDAMGKQFNPELHEAMAAVPSADVPPNTVLEVYEQGYKLHDRVLRPARVVVSREP